MKEKRNLIIAGAVIGMIAVVLVYLGNPKNMGFCTACFIRDTAGGLGLHQAGIVQYIRPEIIGMILGAFLAAFGFKEFQSKGGSSPFTRFVLGFLVMIGALMFLGCPLRMVLRLAGGDLNALVGLIGFVVGISVGIFFLKRGFSLKLTYIQPKAEGLIFPIIQVILLVLVILFPVLFLFSTQGPGSMHAPFLYSLLGGLAVGVLAQRTRFCMAGGIRDLFLFKNMTLLTGFLALLVAALIGNLIFGYFSFGFTEQPIAHSDGLWNFLGMMVVGFGSVLLGGCPLRQTILAGEGNTDSVMTFLGFLAGAASAHNFKLASSAEGPTANGQIAVVAALIILFAIALIYSGKKVKS